MGYNPLTGEGWDLAAARDAWAGSMARARREGPKWQLRGLPVRNGGSGFYWEYFNFQPFTGKVTVEADGFHWSTRSYDTGELIHAGVTTSIYEAYQSVVQNKPVKRSAG